MYIEDYILSKFCYYVHWNLARIFYYVEEVNETLSYIFEFSISFLY